MQLGQLKESLTVIGEREGLQLIKSLRALRRQKPEKKVRKPSTKGATKVTTKKVQRKANKELTHLSSDELMKLMLEGKGKK